MMNQTAGLDPIASTVVEDLIRSVRMKGEDELGKPGKIASYVIVTHQHSTIRRAVDRLLFLHEGKVIWQGTTDEFSTSTNPIVWQRVLLFYSTYGEIAFFLTRNLLVCLWELGWAS